MEWICINTGFADMRRYHLLMDDGLQLVLKYSPLQQSVRLSFRNNHQSFFIESTGGWNHRLVFKTVYGVEVGRFSYNARSQAGRIQIEDLGLQFTMVDKNKPSVVVYEQHKKQVLLTCHLPQELRQHGRIDDLSLACLCLGLGWYLVGNEASIAVLRKRG